MGVIRFPSSTIRLMLDSVVPGSRQVTFRIPMAMSKPDFRSYLTSLYGLDVSAVNTMIYAGKRQRVAGGHVYKRSDWKKAIVTLGNPLQIDPKALEALDVARSREQQTNSTSKPAPLAAQAAQAAPK
ncbi:mitochondrial ribosomal protein L23 (uL23m) [Andalucia godoyi]|uniref:Large ribosomal subunit protein uL23m n=1 Tax=Andalucia godoyi TaxID=505711 RepID=A0A8K0F0Z5_ANDGO|nr:mitochondrial ribosomal protein L23 (uL23m) [Andalucia godoyi]|eukprot:ANDGO_01054.mRNA.1 mitochondrial ribosomal protein L23 (uL23m)